jgi:hypothetical protein
MKILQKIVDSTIILKLESEIAVKCICSAVLEMTLKSEVADSSKMLVSVYQGTRYYTPEGCSIYYRWQISIRATQQLHELS